MKKDVELLFLGIDGLDYDLIHKYDCGFLKFLMKTNQHGVLLSNDYSGTNQSGEPVTGCAWNTIYTGVPADVHGLTGEVFMRAGSFDFEVKVRSIWDILGGNNITLGLLTLAAYKPTGAKIPPLNGWAINGFPCEGKVTENMMFPKFPIPEWFRIEEYKPSMKDKPDDFFEMQKKQVEDKLKLLKMLKVLPRNEVMAIGIQMLDWASHCKHDRKHEYQFIDDWIKRVFAETIPKRFIICSDHGFQEHQSRHRETGAYICSLPGGETPRTIFDVAPLMLFMMKR